MSNCYKYIIVNSDNNYFTTINGPLTGDIQKATRYNSVSYAAKVIAGYSYLYRNKDNFKICKVELNKNDEIICKLN